MKNNNGFGKFEVLTIIVVLLGIGAFVAYRFLGGTPIKKIGTMRDSASTFVKTVVVNYDSFINPQIVYLGEVVDEELMKDVKNPIGDGVCSHSESFVQTENGKNYVTLRCGDYLIDHADVNELKNVDIYQVSDWKDTKTNDDDDERIVYNCYVNEDLVFDEYYDEFYFVYEVNQKFGSSHYTISTVGKTCTVDKKTVYRSKSEVE